MSACSHEGDERCDKAQRRSGLVWMAMEERVVTISMNEAACGPDFAGWLRITTGWRKT
jgi:hypothetical protein